MSHIDVKLSCSKTDQYCPDGSREIALQTSVRGKRCFCKCLALRSCSWAIAALESHLSFIFTATKTCKKENVFKVPKVLLPIRPGGIIWGPLQTRAKSNAEPWPNQQLNPCFKHQQQHTVQVSSLSSLQASFETSPLTTLSLTAPPLEEKCPEGRGQRKEVADWWWLELN